MDKDLKEFYMRSKQKLNHSNVKNPRLGLGLERSLGLMLRKAARVSKRASIRLRLSLGSPHDNQSFTLSWVPYSAKYQYPLPHTFECAIGQLRAVLF